MSKYRVAVVGSGVSGLTAAYLLRHAAEVTVFEANARCGGHAHSHDVAADGRSLAVDSGFLVYNNRTYPLLTRLFAELGVTARASEMSMSVRCDGCGLEYCGARGLGGLFARATNAADPRFLALLAQVPLFHRRARRLLADPRAEPTLGRFVASGGYTRYFVRHFLVPLVSAVWSCGPQLVADYPARYLFQFLDNHGMLSIKGAPQWFTVEGGSRGYVDRIVKRIPTVRTMTAVREIRRTGGGVDIRDAGDTVSRFDATVIATHPDQALRLLADATTEERDVLGAFGYSRNETLLHTDDSVLPRRTKARGGWNYLLPDCAPGVSPARVSYHLNRLQGLDTGTQFVVTLGDTGRIDDSLVLERMRYEHPIYTPESVAAQSRLPGLNTATTVFAGAYHGWGFHEDGCRSGAAAAASLGVAW